MLFFTDTRKLKQSWKDRMYFFAQLPLSFSCMCVLCGTLLITKVDW
jgi:hypothetical protein